ncbi:MAG TPA: 1,2-phenylacetyl-CoA epoxidase subunit PaaC [Actinopolymorphaceae bacterium]
MNPLVTYPLRLGDDALILSHRLGEWVTGAPQLEEDVALANIALDLLGQARNLLTYAGEVEGAGRDEDDLAYFRDEREFLNAQVVELDNGDFAVSIVRHLVFSAYQYELYARLSASADTTLAAIAAKALAEVSYHRDHATQWTLRLGDGTEESHTRMASALDTIWPYVPELFETDELEQTLVSKGIAVDSSHLRAPWESYVHGVLREATLDVPGEPAYAARGGRRGVHTEAMGYLLAEMQHLARSHPGASW